MYTAGTGVGMYGSADESYCGHNSKEQVGPITSDQAQVPAQKNKHKHLRQHFQQQHLWQW